MIPGRPDMCQMKIKSGKLPHLSEYMCLKKEKSFRISSLWIQTAYYAANRRIKMTGMILCTFFI